MRILIIHAPEDSEHAEDVRREFDNLQIDMEIWRLQEDLTAETILNLFMNTFSHFLFILSSEKGYYSPWLYTIIGYCMGKNRNLTCYFPDGTEERPEFLMWVPQIIRLPDIGKYYIIEQQEWKRFEKHDAARRELVELGCALSDKGFAEAVLNHEHHAVELYLDAGFSPDTQDENGVQMICLAVRQKIRSIVDLLIVRGANINAISLDRGNTALMDAASEGGEEITERILASGANLDIQSKNGQTALVLAVGKGDPVIAEMLLKAGADPEIKDKLGMSARGYAKLFKMENVLQLIDTGNLA